MSRVRRGLPILVCSTPRQHLPRVHQVLRIESLFELLHHVKRFAVFDGQEVQLAESDTVFTGTSPVQRKRSLDDAAIQAFGFGELLRVVRIDQEQDVKVSIPNVS